MTRLFLVGIALCLCAAAVMAQVPQAVDLPLANWSVQSQQPADGKGTIAADGLTLTRGAEGWRTYMLRVFQDVPVKAGGVYVFTYRVKVEGEGSSSGIVYCGDAQGKWDETRPRYTETKRKGDFATVKTIVTASPVTVKFRLDVRASGANTTVTYRDVKLEQIGEQPNAVLTPSTAAVTLDGRLDDPLWADAARFSPFRVLGNVETPATVSNEALIALRDGYLYVGYRLAEPNIAGMKATKPKDVSGLSPIGIYNDDCTETFFSWDQVSFAHVIVNAASARNWDQHNVSSPSATWYPTTKVDFNPDWDAKAAVGKGEWTCELRVKLSDLYGESVGGERKLYVNFTRHRTQGTEGNLSYAPIAGQFYAVPREFVPITLQLPALTGPVVSKALTGKFTSRLGVPDLLMAGAPVKLTRHSGVYKLPAMASVAPKGVKIDPGVLQTLREALAVAGGGKGQVALQVGDVFGDKSLSASERARLDSPEAFKLELSPGKAVITGRTQEGVLRGIATLILTANRARLTKEAALPALTLYDAPRLPFRGMMVQLDKRTVDVAFLLRMNKLLVYLDSFGGPTVFPFESYPIGGKKKITKQELVDLFNYCRARGIEPIPYFASWGRVQYLKVMPGGKELLVDDEDVLQSGYRNLDVANPETHKVMLALQQEIIDTLHPKSFCIAMDEAHFGHMVTSPAAKAKNWKPSDWYSTALNVNAAFLRKQGIRMFIWGDMIEPTHNGPHMDMCGPELLARLPKDMTILDWEYSGSREVTEDFPSIKMFRDAGLPTIGCPWYAPKGVARLAHSVAKYGGEGLLLTAWNSSSPDSMPTEWIRACSLTAYLGWSPEDCDLGHFSFVPDAIMEGAAYWQRVNFPAGPGKSVPAPEGLVSGDQLVRLLGLPAGTDPAFTATPYRNVRGATVDVFRRGGQPAAVALTGREYAVVRNGDFAQGVTAWVLDAAEDTTFTGEQGALKVTRLSGNAFRRASQDLPLDPKREYVVRYRVKVEGPGTARAWTYSGDEKFRWDESKSVHSAATKGDWTTKEMPLPSGFAALRISLTADGHGTTAWFDDFEVVEKGVDPATLAPARAVLPVNATARVLTFMHATSRQVIADEDMPANTKKFANIIPGEYRVNYTDGTFEVIPLAYRVNIVAANDPTLGRECDIGLFGTVGGAAFMNLPTFTWLNPHPERTIASIEARSGSSAEMTLLLFGVTLE